VVTARSLGIGTDYARYLEGRAQLPERGDYYLGADGLPAEAPGRWVMLPETQRLLWSGLGFAETGFSGFVLA